VPEEAYPLLATGKWHKAVTEGREILEEGIWSKHCSSLTHWQQAVQASCSSPETVFPCRWFGQAQISALLVHSAVIYA